MKVSRFGSEGTVGLITYMRTDSTRVSPDAIANVREWIKTKLGDAYLPAAPNAFKSKKDAQDAHEAIRPTDVDHHPEEIRRYLSDEQYRLYRLIWQRFVASQMMPAVFDQTTVDIVAKADRNYDFRVTGSVLKFDGFLKVYEEAKDKKDEDDEALANKLPALDEGQSLKLNELKPEQHYTEPPPRYNEASLVKELEEQGIGRPSTYASIINTIQDREYVQKIGGRSGRVRPDGNRHCRHRSAGQELPLHLRHEVHGETRRGAGRHRRRPRKVDRSAAGLLRPFCRRARGCQQAHGKHQADGEANGREVSTYAAHRWC